MKPKPDEKLSLKHKIVWQLELLAVYFFKAIFYLFPYKYKIEIGKKLGSLIFKFDGKHRRVCLDNVKSAFPHLDDNEVFDLAKKSFENIGRLFVEIIYLKRLFRNIFSKSRIIGWENLQELQLKNEGYFLVSGHFGNWEYVAYMQSQLGYPLEMVTRPLDNPFLEKFFRKIREASGNRVVYKRNAVREMARAIKSKEGVAFVFDQNFGEEGAIFVPFFGRLAATTPALGKIAARLKTPILPVFAVPEGTGYKIIYEKPVYPELSENYEKEAIRLTEVVTKLLEERIRETPYAWFWMHNRWRTQPKSLGKEG